MDSFRLSTNINLVPNIGNLQAQLDKIGKQLKMNISNINLSTKGALSTSSVDKLILRYKAGHVAIQEFIKYSQQMINSSSFTNKSLQDQAKIVQALGNAQRQLAQQQTQTTQQTQQSTQTTRQQTQAMIQNEKVAQQQAKTAMMEAKAQEALAKAQLAQLKIQQQQNVLTQQAVRIQQQAAKAAQQANASQQATRTSQQQVVSNQQTMSSIDKLILRYKTYKISLEQFMQYGSRIQQSEAWKNKTLQQQAKLIEALTRAERDRNKAIAEGRSTANLASGIGAQQQQYLSRMDTMQVGREQIFNTAPVQTAMNNLINSIRTLGTVGGKTTKQINAEMARFANTVRQAEAAEKALTFQQQQMQKLERMQVGKAQVFATPEIQRELQMLMTSIRSVGTQGGKSMTQVRQEMARFSTSVAEATVRTAQLRRETNSFLGNLGGLLKKFADWMIVGTAIMQTIRFVREGIKYVYELDGALNQIRIVTGQTQEQVEKLALGYNNLAKSMGVTTTEIAKASVELYRQGLSVGEVDERMRSIIQYAKISGITTEESNKIITATMNSMGTSAQKTIDVMAMLGGFRPTKILSN